MIAYLRDDLHLHYRDEDEDLFPVLKRRAHANDNLEDLLVRLSEDHRQATSKTEAIIQILVTPTITESRVFERADRDRMAAYAESEQRHLAIENGIVLVIARMRLTHADLKSISQSMKVRRGMAT